MTNANTRKRNAFERQAQRIRELEAHVESLQAKVHLCAAYDALEAKLAAVEGLPEKWREGERQYGDTVQDYRSVAECADELQAALKR